jgi:hypothetical protein
MKKINATILIVLVIISGLQSFAIATDDASDIREQTFPITFSQPILKDTLGSYLKVSMPDEHGYMMRVGKPMLPILTTKIELPIDATNIHVNVIPLKHTTQSIDKEIEPAQNMQPLNQYKSGSNQFVKDETCYQSNEWYPENWYTYRITSGINKNFEHKLFVSIYSYPVRYQPAANTLHILKEATIDVQYETNEKSFLPEEDAYDLVIIAPNTFSSDLQRLIDHKNNIGVKTILKTTEEIYSQYTGVDKPEQIKYFIKDALETWNNNYVMLVGGLDSMIYGTSRDDRNQGSKDWYVPVRYTNLYAGLGDDPGYISDLYYADIYKYNEQTQTLEFDDWDSNGNGIFAEWTQMRRDVLDLSPDVSVGRLACRNSHDVNIMIDKIINYEQTPADPSWFNKMITISGDAFQDQVDLDIIWNVNEIDSGMYTIHAQSNNEDDVYGPVDTVEVTVDQSSESSITFLEDDNLKTDTYPFDPIAEITSPSPGDILGNTDVSFIPPEAYSGESWARVEYIDGVMHIRGKSYDPRPYGIVTDLKVWITNEDDEIVFTAYRNNTKTYYEDELSTGEQVIDGRGGSLYYMPGEFEKIKLWTSNGLWNDQSDVLEAFSQGAGFIHFSGHASPRTWGDQYPGIPGGRMHASVTGLICFNPFALPMFPMNKLTNGEKLPIVVACGCHNGQFNVTILSTLLSEPYMWTYGVPIPKCWSWWLASIPNGGSIATISNTGMGYGMQGLECISAGLNPWLDTEFFRLYGQEHMTTLGQIHAQSIGNYVQHFNMDDSEDGIGHVKSVQEWTLLGDPSLHIGGKI